jgi:hypothetical protein
MPAQALAKYKSVRPARRVAGQSRYTTNIATHNESEEFVIPIRSSTTEITCSGTFLTHYEFTGSLEVIATNREGRRGLRSRGMRRAMSMKTLMSAAHAAGYAMAAEEFSEPRPEVVPASHSNAVVVRQASHRGRIANAQRTLRRMWLRAWASDHWGHRAAA